MAVFCTPTINGYGRFRPNAMAPQAVLWGRDNRGAMLRVLGALPATPATRIENRIGEPSANPYLYIAAQIHAGLDGMRARPEPRRRPPTRPMRRPAPTPLPAEPRRGARRARRRRAAGRGLRRAAGRLAARASSAPSSRATTQADDKDAWQRARVLQPLLGQRMPATIAIHLIDADGRGRTICGQAPGRA